MGKYGGARRATDNIIQRMCFACWIYKSTHTHTHTHTKYVIFVDFPRQQWLPKHSSLLHYTYIVCLVLSAINSGCGLRPFPYKNNAITIISRLLSAHFQPAEHLDVLLLSAETSSISVPPLPLLFDLGATLLGRHTLQQDQQNCT